MAAWLQCCQLFSSAHVQSMWKTHRLRMRRWRRKIVEVRGDLGATTGWLDLSRLTTDEMKDLSTISFSAENQTLSFSWFLPESTILHARVTNVHKIIIKTPRSELGNQSRMKERHREIRTASSPKPLKFQHKTRRLCPESWHYATVELIKTGHVRNFSKKFSSSHSWQRSSPQFLRVSHLYSSSVQ